nr:MAG TPA: hypothetical protein [Caudoviricetes sp.]
MSILSLALSRFWNMWRICQLLTLRRWCTARTVPIGLRWVIAGTHATMGFCRQRIPMIFVATAQEWTVMTMPKRINPRRRPATQADVQRAKDTATADACRVTLAIFFTALLDKEGMDAEQLQRIWREVEALSESVRDGYVSAPDLIRVLREEYEINIIGG